MLSRFMVISAEGVDPISTEGKIFAIILVAVIFILLYIFREKRRKNKYEPEKKHDRDDPNNYWGPLGSGDPIGPPKGFDTHT